MFGNVKPPGRTRIVTIFLGSPRLKMIRPNASARTVVTSVPDYRAFRYLAVRQPPSNTRCDLGLSLYVDSTVPIDLRAGP